VRHKWFVLVAAYKIGASLWAAITHDISKFRPSEWLPYCRYFYGNYMSMNESHHLFTSAGVIVSLTKEEVASAFDLAWLHHQHRNPHHWQYWVLNEDSGNTKILPMPERYWLEMVADWMGAGRAITGKWETKEWYLKNRHNIMLHGSTRLSVEALLGVV
jgi:hypothetical protein